MCDKPTGQSTCESLAMLGLLPCWAQQAPLHSSQLFTPKPFNLGFEPALFPAQSNGQADQARRLQLEDVLSLAADRFNVWLHGYVEGLAIDLYIPNALFSSSSLLSGHLGGQGLVALARGKSVLERKIADRIRQNVARGVCDDVERGLREVFRSDVEGDIQLVRFDAILSTLTHCAQSSLEEFTEKFHEASVRRVRFLFDWASGCNDLENVWGTGVSLHAALCASVKESIVQASLLNNPNFFLADAEYTRVLLIDMTLTLAAQELLAPLFADDPDSFIVDASAVFMRNAAQVVKCHDERAFLEGTQVGVFMSNFCGCICVLLS